MENLITCPHCMKTILNNSVIDSAAKGEDLGSTFIIFDCGEKITFSATTAQLRDQKMPGRSFQNWFYNHIQARV